MGLLFRCHNQPVRPGQNKEIFFDGPYFVVSICFSLYIREPVRRGAFAKAGSNSLKSVDKRGNGNCRSVIRNGTKTAVWLKPRLGVE
ncbi:MAG: hypothetical protein KGY74_09740 [Candidatus Cloacimonetes bacterium]|nr:hypothetical protein [Candidatus Cloacimonadota bacterium]